MKSQLFVRFALSAPDGPGTPLSGCERRRLRRKTVPQSCKLLFATLAAVLGLLPGNLPAQVTSTWNGGTADWSQSTAWTPKTVPNSASADVYIHGSGFSSSTVTASGAFTVGRLTLDNSDQLTIADGGSLTVASGAFSGSGTLLNYGSINLASTGKPTELRFNGNLTISGQTLFEGISLPGMILLSDDAGAANRIGAKTPGGRLTIGANQLVEGPGFIGLGRTNITNNGMISGSSAIAGSGNGSTRLLVIEPGNGSGGGEMINNGTVSVAPGMTVQLSGTSGGKFTNNGNLSPGGYLGNVLCTMQITPGALTNFSGTTLTGGTYIVGEAGVLSLGGGNIVTNRADVQLSAKNAVFDEIKAIANNQGTFRVGGDTDFTTKGSFTNSGTLIVTAPAKLTVSGALTQSASGALLSTATIGAAGFTLDGTIVPADRVGATMTLNGPVTFKETTSVVFGLGGCDFSGDKLKIDGNLTLAGTVDFTSLPGKTGRYHLIDYTGTLTNHTLHVGSLPAGTTAKVNTSTPGQVNLDVTVVENSGVGPYRAIVSVPSRTPGPGNPVVVFPDVKNQAAQQRSLTCGLPSDGIPGLAAVAGSDTVLLPDVYKPRIFVIRISTGALLATIDTTSAGSPIAAAVSPDASVALFATSDRLGVLHAPFNASSKITTVPLPQNYGRQIVFSGTGRAFIYDSGVGVTVVDPPYTAVAFTIPISSNGSFAISSDGSTLVTTDNTSNKIAVFKAPFSSTSSASTLTIPGANNLYGIAIAPNGATAIVGEADEDRAFAISAPFGSNSKVENLPLPPRGSLNGGGFSTVAFSPDSQLAIIGGGGKDFFIGPMINLRAPFTAAGVQASLFYGSIDEPPQIEFALPGIAPSKLLNISTRLKVGTNENALIGGFIVTGAELKKVMVRGIGPSLPVAGKLADPTLELNHAGKVIASNDNWKSTQKAEIEATTIPPKNDLESAIVRTLDPGAYTATLRGAGGGTGVGLVEVYDLAQTASSQLANISTRGFVDTGDNVMIGGVIAGGGNKSTAKILVRAIGPSLAGQGVPGALLNPTLELHNANGSIIAQNDSWKATQRAEIEATTIPPTDDREAAIVKTVSAGNYTAIVRGAGGTTGVGLVEVYNLQ